MSSSVVVVVVVVVVRLSVPIEFPRMFIILLTNICSVIEKGGDEGGYPPHVIMFIILLTNISTVISTY